MRVEVKIGTTTYEVDNARTAAALRQCKTEEAAGQVMDRAAAEWREKSNGNQT